MENSNSFWVTEYTGVTSQFSSLLGLYVKVFAIYVGILGLAIKFALDSNSTSVLRCTLAVFAIMICSLFQFVIVFAKKLVCQLEDRRNTALSHLKKSVSSEFHIGHSASRAMTLFNVVSLVGWVSILVCGVFIPQ